MIYVGKKEYRNNKTIISYMTADTLPELHSMANNIGIHQRSFQNHNGKIYYAISKSRKNIALKLGAIEVCDKDLFLNKKYNYSLTPNNIQMTGQEKRLLIMIYELLPAYWTIWANKSGSWSLGEIVCEYKNGEVMTKTFEEGSLEKLHQVCMQRFNIR